MKRFEELTLQQQNEAKLRTRAMMNDALRAGQITNLAMGEQADAYADAAAEDAYYTEKGDLLIEGVVE